MHKTVVFGGTFNPIHNGHLMMAQAAVALPFVDELCLVPVMQPPHKDATGQLVGGSHRMEMCRLASKLIKNCNVSDIELIRSGKSYTYDTLCELRRKYPSKEFCLLIGGDMVATFHEWFKYKDILKMADLIVVTRKEVATDEFTAAVNSLLHKGGTLHLLNIDTPDISSTEIRKRISIGLDVSGMIPVSVEQYIKRNGLYL